MKAKEKGKIVAIVEKELGSDSGDETKIIVMGLKGQHVESTSSSNSCNNTPNEYKREELFTLRVISNHTRIDALLDSGSQANLIPKDLVKELKLETVPHHKPYPLGWIVKGANLQVSRKCIFRFAITANFVDEVDLDVVPLDIFGIILGSPYLYDRKAVFHRYERKYNFLKDGVKYIVRAHRKKLNISLVNAGQMKRLVNASRNLTLSMIKQRDVLNHTFHKDAYIFNELFQNDNRFPLKQDKKHL